MTINFSGPQAFFELTLNRAKARLIDDRQRVTQAVLNSANQAQRTRILTDTSTDTAMKAAHRKHAKMSPLFDHPGTDQTFGYKAGSLLKDETKPHMRRRHTVVYTAH